MNLSVRLISAFHSPGRFGARVHLVHVYEGAHQFSTVATSPVLWSEAEAKRHLADEVELAFGTRPRRDDCHLRIGKPHQEIVATAEEVDADLIVIAKHGHTLDSDRPRKLFVRLAVPSS